MTPDAVMAALPVEACAVLGRDRVERVVRRAMGQVVAGDRLRVATRTGPEKGTVESVVFRGLDRAGRERWLATVALDGGERWVSLPSWEDIEWERI